jgi:hypothetical protein
MNVQQLLSEILAPESPATVNERDAAAELSRHIAAAGINAEAAVPVQIVYGYYQRVHLSQMATNLQAAGA